jgi:hypothetical protein
VLHGTFGPRGNQRKLFLSQRLNLVLGHSPSLQGPVTHYVPDVVEQQKNSEVPALARRAIHPVDHPVDRITHVCFTSSSPGLAPNGPPCRSLPGQRL